MLTRTRMLVWIIAGCGSVEGQQPDAGHGDAGYSDAGYKQSDASVPDASAICDPTGTFEAPVRLTEFDTVDASAPPRLTADELEIYFTEHMESDADLYRAQRSATNQPFGTPIALTHVNSTAADDNPSVTNDGLMLFFESTRLSGQVAKLFVSTRPSRVGEFGAPSEIANVNSTTVTDNDAQPFVTTDGQELWFVSNRAGGLGARDIDRAVWSGSSFASAAAITALSSTADDFLPTLSADKLTVYFSSTRLGGKGGFDIWTAHRSKSSDEFHTLRLVPELNSNTNEWVGWLSPDNCRIYFTSDVAGTFHIYVASRHPG